MIYSFYDTLARQGLYSHDDDANASMSDFDNKEFLMHRVPIIMLNDFVILFFTNHFHDFFSINPEKKEKVTCRLGIQGRVFPIYRKKIWVISWHSFNIMSDINVNRKRALKYFIFQD